MPSNSVDELADGRAPPFPRADLSRNLCVRCAECGEEVRGGDTGLGPGGLMAGIPRGLAPARQFDAMCPGLDALRWWQALHHRQMVLPARFDLLRAAVPAAPGSGLLRGGMIRDASGARAPSAVTLPISYQGGIRPADPAAWGIANVAGREPGDPSFRGLPADAGMDLVPVEPGNATDPGHHGEGRFVPPCWIPEVNPARYSCNRVSPHVLIVGGRATPAHGQAIRCPS